MTYEPWAPDGRCRRYRGHRRGPRGPAPSAGRAVSSCSHATTRSPASSRRWWPTSMRSAARRSSSRVDQEGGRVQRFRSGFSVLPPPRRIGHEFDLDARQGLELARSMGWLMAAELRAHGVDLSFAPCVDLDYGVSEVIGDRAFHSQARRGRRSSRSRTCTACAMRAWRPPPNIFPVMAPWSRTRTRRCRWIGATSSIWMTTSCRIAGSSRTVCPACMAAHVLFPAVDDAVPASVSPRWIAERAARGAAIQRRGVHRRHVDGRRRRVPATSSRARGARSLPAATWCWSATTAPRCVKVLDELDVETAAEPRTCAWSACAARRRPSATSCYAGDAVAREPRAARALHARRRR